MSDEVPSWHKYIRHGGPNSASPPQGPSVPDHYQVVGESEGAPPGYRARIFFGFVIAVGLAIAAAATYHVVWLMCLLTVLAVLLGVSLFVSGTRRRRAARGKTAGGLLTWAIATALIVICAVVWGQNWAGTTSPQIAINKETPTTLSAVTTSDLQPSQTAGPSTTKAPPAAQYVAALDSLVGRASSAEGKIANQLSRWDDPGEMADGVAELLQLPASVPASTPSGWSEINDRARSALAQLKGGANDLMAAVGSSSEDLLARGLVTASAEETINAGMAALRGARSQAGALLAEGTATTSGTASASTGAGTLSSGTTSTLGVPSGTREAPVPLGQEAQVGWWKVKVVSASLDATQAILDANEWNSEPTTGSQYVLVSLEYTRTDHIAGTFWSEVTETFLDREGGWFFEATVFPPNPMPLTIEDEGYIAEPGETHTGDLVFEVLSSQVSGGVLELQNRITPNPGPPVYFATQ
jgi:hypothetical protein